MTMYKGHELEAVSYENLNTGRWIPVVHITYPKGTSITTLPLTDLDHEQDTRAAADGYALTMGQQWVDNHT
jgi:hypothetical protein